MVDVLLLRRGDGGDLRGDSAEAAGDTLPLEVVDTVVHGMNRVAEELANSSEIRDGSGTMLEDGPIRLSTEEDEVVYQGQVIVDSHFCCCFEASDSVEEDDVLSDVADLRPVGATVVWLDVPLNEGVQSHEVVGTE
jgi:hypothetical protein